MSTIFTRDFGLEAAKGTVGNHSTINKFGRNSDIDTTTDPEDIWTGGGVWVAPTQARTHQIVSTSTNDDGSPAGTGARTLRVYGLTSWSSAETTEDITMNGTTNVATANQYVIIYRLKVLTCGSSGPNVGTITATADTDATVTARVEIGEGQTLMAIYAIPSTQDLYLYKVKIFSNVAIGASGILEAKLLVNPVPDSELACFLTKDNYAVDNNTIPYCFVDYYPPKIISGPAIIKISANTVSVNNMDVSAGFDGIVVTR